MFHKAYRRSNLEKRVDFYCRLCDAGESSLGTLAGASQTSQCTGVIRNVVLGFSLELVLEMFQKGVVKVLTTQVSVTGCGLDGENSTGDVEQRNIKSSSTQIEDEDILLSLGLLVKTVSNRRSCWLVDDRSEERRV